MEIGEKRVAIISVFFIFAVFLLFASLVSAQTYDQTKDPYTFSGKVGIGTTAPNNKLEVFNGNILLNDNITPAYGVSPNKIILQTNAQVTPAIEFCGMSGCGRVSYDSDNGIYTLVGGTFKVVGNIKGTTGLCIGSDCRTSWPVSQNGSNYSFSGNVGIGTTNPRAKLDVNGYEYLTGGNQIQITNSPGSTGFQIAGADGSLNLIGTMGVNEPLAFRTVQVERMRIDTSGNVGIGTTEPSSLLEISGINSNADLRLTRTNNVSPGSEMGKITFLAPNTSGISRDWAQLRVVVENATAGSESAGLAFNTRNGDNSFPERVRIDGKGNVGIGTTTPDSKLHVTGNAHVTGNLQVDGNIAAKYQDLAEYVRTSESLTKGMVVMIDTREVNQVVPSDKAYNTLVAGVVSENPGIILGENGADKAIIAHTGRVKVKVDTSNGEISVGDLLVSSPVKGRAMKADSDKLKPGMLLGKALESLTKDQQGEILVLLTLQ
jgi:hypothetical protein